MVLGLIAVDGPCTAYAVRLVLKKSLSGTWSGSAGAVYPAVERLLIGKYITATAASTGLRRSKKLALSSLGLKALKQWLNPHVSPLAATVPSDPLRTRLRFLSLLTKSEQKEFLDDAMAKTRLERDKIELDFQQRTDGGDNDFAVAMAYGALKMAEARVDMISRLIDLRNSRDAKA